jgi:hypothetical protein
VTSLVELLVLLAGIVLVVFIFGGPSTYDAQQEEEERR